MFYMPSFESPFGCKEQKMVNLNRKGINWRDTGRLTDQGLDNKRKSHSKDPSEEPPA